MAEKKHPRPAEPEPNVVPEGASPLGRGADPGVAGDEGASGIPDAQGISGPRGAATPGARGGPSGMVDRENEDVVPKARHDAEVLDG